MESIEAQKDILRILIASQKAQEPVSLDTGIAQHALETYDDDSDDDSDNDSDDDSVDGSSELDLAKDQHTIGTPGAPITAAQLLRALERIEVDDFEEGRSYCYEGMQLKRSKDGHVKASFEWGS